MNLSLSSEQHEIARTVDQLLDKEMSRDRVRELAVADLSAFDTDLWARCAADGWLGLGISEEDGGVGLGAVEECLLLRGIGRHVAPGPFRSTILAAHVAAAAGRLDLVEGLVGGTTRCGSLVGDVGIDAEEGHLLLECRDGAILVHEATLGDPVAAVDTGTRLREVVRNRVVAESADRDLVARARLHVAAESLGVLDAVSHMSASYACQREQFGAPIGSFQAVKHRCADMAIDTYASASIVAFAAHKLDRRDGDAWFHAASSFLVAVDAAVRGTASNIQNHGAIGFTLEHDAHLYLRRAHTLEHALEPIACVEADLLTAPRHHFE